MPATCIRILSLLFIAAGLASAQTAQIGKRWDFPRTLSDKLQPLITRVEKEDWPIESSYVQSLQERIATGAGLSPAVVQVTDGATWYAFLTSDGRLFLSSGLLARVSTEGELAGLLAHLLAHTVNNRQSTLEQCVLAADYLPTATQGKLRIQEKMAAKTAIRYMKTARYDPESMLDILSIISYENQKWSKAIVSDDLLELRVVLENETLPANGFLLQSSDFWEFHNRLRPMGVTSAPVIRASPGLGSNENHARPPTPSPRAGPPRVKP